MTGGMSDTVGSTDGVRAGSWGSCDKHWIPNMLQQDDQCEAGVYTHIDSANPIRFLLGGECSPFSPYRWLCTGPLLIRAKHSACRPKESQSNRKKFVDEHI